MWLAAAPRPADASAFVDTQWPTEGGQDAREPEGAFERISKTYFAARTLVGLALLASLGALWASGQGVSPYLLAVATAYLALAGASSLWATLRPDREEVLATYKSRDALAIGVDILVFTSLQLIDSLRTLNFAALLALPVLMAGVLMPRRLAIGTAAGVSLVLMGLALQASLETAPGWTLLAPSGLAGIGLFLVAWLAGEMAQRLARERQRARDSLLMARQQARLNRLMIDGMAEGVLVVDRALRVQAANAPAWSLLGFSALPETVPVELRGKPEWAALADAVEQGFGEMRWPEAGRDVLLSLSEPVVLRVRMRFTGPLDVDAGQAMEAAPDFCLLLAEESRSAQARVQQEKLAAMGRMSAGVAHEIRNPLAAISQANALWREENLPAPQRRLSDIVHDNVARLQRLVDDVLQAIPSQTGEPVPVDVVDAVRRSVQAWQSTAAVGAERVQIEAPEVSDTPMRVLFDPEHLRRLLVNLLDNAHRHASPAQGALRVRVQPVWPQGVRLEVSNDGPLIEPQVQARLFEPFFSTFSRGSGLGLYICRELCERYGARIEYQPVQPADAFPSRAWPAFVVNLRRST